MSSTNSSRVEDTGAYKFAVDVIEGKIVSGKRRIDACRRFINDLEKSKEDSWAWAFDVERAYRPINFIEKFMRPTKGHYSKMELLPWQHFIEANLFGWIDKKTGLRRFREGLILVGAGNGKSTLVAGNAAYGLAKDGERGAEIYCLANSSKQARIVFEACKDQIMTSPILRDKFIATNTQIRYEPTKSKFEVLATDGRNLDGRNVHMGIFDELQEYRDYKLIDNIVPKGKKRRQPLMLYISTFGTVIDGPLMDMYIRGCDILQGTTAIEPRAYERMFVYIDEIDDGDDPADFQCWGKANPSLGALLKLEDLKDEWAKARDVPAQRSTFINKQLNVFTLVDELGFVEPDVIRRNNQTVTENELKGLRCWGGFDLSETEDFTSACIEWKMPDGRIAVLEHSWVPEKKKRINAEKISWDHLQEQGWLTVLDAEYVDHFEVAKWFEEQRQKFNVMSIGYDPAKAISLVREMKSKGFVLNPVRQGELTLTAPLDNLKELLLDGKVCHNNNQVFNWYLGNVKLTKRGVNATYLPTKQNRYRKIDGVSALLAAHTEMLRQTENERKSGDTTIVAAIENPRKGKAYESFWAKY